MNRIIKKTIIPVLLLAGVLSLSATDFKLDNSGNKTFNINSKVGAIELKFVSSAPLEEIIGYVDVESIKSTINLDPGNIEKTNGKISFPVKSLETGIKVRNQHLYSDTWLNADKNPQITFDLRELNNVKVRGVDPPAGRSTVNATAVGTFTMNGKTKNITVPLTITYIKESEATKKRASGDFVSFDGNFQIALADFDVKGKDGVVGSKVGETISISLRLFYNSK